MQLNTFIQSHTNYSHKAVSNTVELLSQDATIPFIARYRKENTGNLNEVDIEVISDLLQTFKTLQKRKLAVLKAIEAQDGLTRELTTKIEETSTLAELEDLYLPFKKKRKTKADTARENGLEPLAKLIYAQEVKDPKNKASEYANGVVETTAQAIEGAQNIIAEWINEDQELRTRMRRLYSTKAQIITKKVPSKAESVLAQKYKQYFDWEEALKTIPSHRFLAIYRAQNEGFLRVKIEVKKEKALQVISEKIIKPGNNPCTKILAIAIEDSFTRLLNPSFNSEFLVQAKNTADEKAILVFADNLEQLLLSPPLGRKRILAIDPGFKSGCKVVCLDENGSFLHHENIYPHPPQNKKPEAEASIRSLVKAYKIEAIAIGNGTASRETESFVKGISLGKEIEVYVVNEAGASVYSASKIAREEFPDLDVTVRGAISIGRRLMDPLAELVNIDPKSIGVGQYQHEVDPQKLKIKLSAVVKSCVNRIGVNVNTAGKELLSYVSGIGPSLADKILEYRRENGLIQSRKELLKIPGLGAKSFEQAAGFLRVKNASNPLDDSAVHPERYPVVELMARDLKVSLPQIIGNKNLIAKIEQKNYINEDLGIHTFKDILQELEKPGVDIRNMVSTFEFDPSVKKFEDLKPGMKLPGIVNNITNFGCFVDIGIKESGLIHISQLAKGYVNDVSSIVKLNQKVMVTILKIDEEQRKIQLSLLE